MAKKKIDAMVCDNPDCEKTTAYVRGEDLPLGVYFTYMIHSGGGGWGERNVYACSRECVLQVIEAGWDRQ